jgi:hypothetical protein
MPVTSVVAVANTSTVVSRGTVGIGSRFGGSEPLIAGTAHAAPRRPSAPPIEDIVTLSTRS